MSEYETLDVSVQDDVFRIAFDRPDNYNAADPEMHKELMYVWDEATESDARVVLLTGNNGMFSAGGDIEGMQRRIDNPGERPWEVTRHEGETIINRMLDVKKPIIAKVNGHATGLATTLALFCDIVYMEEGSKIGDPHVNVGLVAGDGGAAIWPHLVDIHTAKELLMTGKLLPASEAEDIGLINYAVPPEDLDDEVDEMIDTLASGPQSAIGYTKMAINNYLQDGVDSILRESLLLEGLSQQHADHEEAVDAFLNNRTPNFPSGRDPGE